MCFSATNDNGQTSYSIDFAKHHRIIASVDTLKRPARVKRLLEAPKWDLVVFDEASQIRVADAIGAMGRGASVVVVSGESSLEHAAPSMPRPNNSVTANGTARRLRELRRSDLIAAMYRLTGRILRATHRRCSNDTLGGRVGQDRFSNGR